ncbi:MAG: ZIP family metal transporter [Candidatus Limnocylindrales bacterium]
MTIEAIAVSLGAFLSAMSGGWLALRAVRYVGAIIAVGAGIRIGAAFVDLIPEAIEHLGSLDAAMFWTTLGFVSFYVVDKLTSLHVGHETAAELDHEEADHQHIGVVGAAGMGIHSLLDGVALAAGLAAGGAIGTIIAFVVIVHRFSDGIGVVSFLLTSRMEPRIAMRWVAIVAAAPLVGVVIGSLLTVPESALGAMLAFFAGFFLYVGAAELLPEAHRRDGSRYIVLATLAGVALIYGFSIWVGSVGVAH